MDVFKKILVVAIVACTLLALLFFVSAYRYDDGYKQKVSQFFRLMGSFLIIVYFLLQII